MQRRAEIQARTYRLLTEANQTGYDSGIRDARTAELASKQKRKTQALSPNTGKLSFQSSSLTSPEQFSQLHDRFEGIRQVTEEAIEKSTQSLQEVRRFNAETKRRITDPLPEGQLYYLNTSDSLTPITHPKGVPDFSKRRSSHSLPQRTNAMSTVQPRDQLPNEESFVLSTWQREIAKDEKITEHMKRLQSGTGILSQNNQENISVTPPAVNNQGFLRRALNRILRK